MRGKLALAKGKNHNAHIVRASDDYTICGMYMHIDNEEEMMRMAERMVASYNALRNHSIKYIKEHYEELM